MTTWTFFGWHGSRTTIAAERFGDAREWARCVLNCTTVHWLSPTWDDADYELRRVRRQLQVRNRPKGGDWRGWEDATT